MYEYKTHAGQALLVTHAHTKKRYIIRDIAEKQHSRDEQKTNEEIHIGSI